LCAYNRQLPIKQLNEKGQKDKQQSIKHVHKTEDQITRTTLKTGGELKCHKSIEEIGNIFKL
jgi:hypothetical protein